MIIDPRDFQSRLRVMLGLQGAELTDGELTQMAERYPMCAGKDRWDVRQYAGRAAAGTREYRVMRGTSIQDVYRSAQRGQAEAVGTALNDLESQAGEGPTSPAFPPLRPGEGERAI
ncbi:MAG TPA: hypothetical protein VGQ06_07450 [Gemmatimonadales bacterium]|jgi:hypothetical protein|nr:hypothetical protein [Gemmatimonadales bacterium]